MLLGNFIILIYIKGTCQNSKYGTCRTLEGVGKFQNVRKILYFFI